MHRFIRGFTLIELMIVISILAIVIAFGWPSYRDQVIKARRADGTIFLLELADLQERFFIDQGTYTTTIGDLGFASTTHEDGFYTATLAAGSTGTIATSFQLTATPQKGQANDSCGNLILDSLGQRSVSGSGNHCWD